MLHIKFQVHYSIRLNTVKLYVLTLLSSSCLSQNTEKVALMVKAIKAHRSYTNMVGIHNTRVCREFRRSMVMFFLWSTRAMCRAKPTIHVSY